MKLLSFAFRNLCSYGNKLQSFTFSDDPQLILVEGKNGGGKSTLSDALTFAVYGKSAIRKTKELPNRLNKNGYTFIEFIDNSGSTVSIERGLEPNYSRLAINGIEHNLPDKRRTDEFIEEELIKIPFNVFSNTISLSINDFKSFVKLSPNDKRQIIDKIFGFEIINDMSKKNKEDLRVLRTLLQTIDAKIDSNSKLLESSNEQLSAMKEDLSAMKEAKKNELIEKIDSLTKNKNTYRETYRKLNDAALSLEKELSVIKEARTAATISLGEINKKLQIYDSNKCPHCLSDLTDDGHVKIKDNIVSEKTTKEQLITDLSKKMKDLEPIFSSKKLELSSAQDEFNKVEFQLLPLKKELSNLSLDDAMENKDGTEYLINTIDAINKLLDQVKSEKVKVSGSVGLALEMEEILSDNGMKRLLMNQILPILNKKILRTAKVLDFPFSFEFDMNFEPIITQLGTQVSAESLSTGEQKKMNLIVLLGIIELIKLKHHRVNLLFLDEIFSSLDVESIYKVVDLLKTFSKKYKMTIFVISHSTLPEELFDRKLSVQKIDHFSDISFS